MEKIKLDYDLFDWALCQADNCPQAEDCLRHISHFIIPAEVTKHNCVLASACTNDGQCPMFVSTEPVLMARGMRHLLAEAGKEQGERIRADLYKLFGNKRRYYRFAQGDYRITPEMQAQVAELLNRHGLEGEPKFDQTFSELNFLA